MYNLLADHLGSLISILCSVDMCSTLQLSHIEPTIQHRSVHHKALIPQSAAIRTVFRQRYWRAPCRFIAASAASGGFGNTAREPNFDSVSFRPESGASASTSDVIDVTDEDQKNDRMNEVKEFLKAELDRIFTSGVSCRSSCASRFTTPVFRMI